MAAKISNVRRRRIDEPNTDVSEVKKAKIDLESMRKAREKNRNLKKEAETLSEKTEDSKTYEIQKLIKHSSKKSGEFEVIQYEVKWKGYRSSENTCSTECRANDWKLVRSYWMSKFNIKSKKTLRGHDPKLRVEIVERIMAASITHTFLAINDYKYLDSQIDVLRELMPWIASAELMTEDEFIANQSRVFIHFQRAKLNEIIKCKGMNVPYEHAVEIAFDYDIEEKRYSVVPPCEKFAYGIEWPNTTKDSARNFETSMPYVTFDDAVPCKDLRKPLLLLKEDSVPHFGDKPPPKVQLVWEEGSWKCANLTGKFWIDEYLQNYANEWCFPANKLVCRLAGKVVPVSRARDIYRKIGELSRRFFVALPKGCGLARTHVLDRTEIMDFSLFMTQSCDPNCEVIWKRDPYSTLPMETRPWVGEVRTTQRVSPGELFTIDWFKGQESKGGHDEYVQCLDNLVDFVHCHCDASADLCRLLLFVESAICKSDRKELKGKGKKERLAQCDLSSYFGSILHIE